MPAAQTAGNSNSNDASVPLDQPTEASAPLSGSPAPLHRTLIEPARGWQFINAAELWQNRELLFFLIWRDVKVRYKQTLLGAAWAIIQPAMTMIVFTIVFGKMAKMEENIRWPYPIFCFAGVLPWFFFQTAVSQSGNSVVGSERLITKIYFPRLAIPFASVGAAIVDFCIAFSLLAILMICYRVTPTLQILWTIPILMLIAILALGVGTLLAALNVAYRDVRYVIPFLLQIWMYATSTIYAPLSPETGQTSLGKFHLLLFANPMSGLIMAFRNAVLGQPMPDTMLLSAATIAILTFLVGCLYFRKVEDSFADRI